MSDITLSNAVRTNLSSLQGTASLLERTQERLSSGNSVNSALDSPVNFFTASGLTERAGDLTNLLDSVSNSVQTLSAADEGITAIQSLVESAEATARQALQAPQSFDSKATVSTIAFDGITEDDLLANPINTPAALVNSASITTDGALTTALDAAVTAAEATATLEGAGDLDQLTAATMSSADFTYTAVAANGNTNGGLDANDSFVFEYTVGGESRSVSLAGDDFSDAASFASALQTQLQADGDLGSDATVVDNAGTIEINIADGRIDVEFGTTIDVTDDAGATTNVAAAASQALDVSDSQITIGYGTSTVTYTQVGANSDNDLNTFTDISDLSAKINADFGSGIAAVSGSDLVLTGQSGNYSDDFIVSSNGGGTFSVTPTAAEAGSDADVLTVNGLSYTYVASGADASANEFSNLSELNSLLNGQGLSAVFDSNNSNELTITTEDSTDLSTTIEVGGTAASKLFGTTTYAEATADGTNGLAGQTLTVGSDDASVTLTFGTGSGQVSTLEGLNDLINDAGLEASLSDDGAIVFETVNSRGLDTLQLSASTAQENQVNISGTIIQTDGALDNQVVTDAVANTDETEARERLVTDYNEILQQITDLAADSSYNGINLLNGDDLEVIFNENNTSSLKIEGVTFNASTLGLDDIVDTDFLDADSINEVLSSLDSASVTLRSQASKFGSNLSVVETRQDFTNELVNVLESGAANLTLADLNEEAANSAALSTRQQIATSALSLAAQSDQGILQLLR